MPGDGGAEVGHGPCRPVIAGGARGLSLQAAERLAHCVVLGVTVVGLSGADETGHERIDLALLEVEVDAQGVLQAGQHLLPLVIASGTGQLLQQSVHVAVVLLQQRKRIGRGGRCRGHRCLLPARRRPRNQRAGQVCHTCEQGILSPRH